MISGPVPWNDVNLHLERLAHGAPAYHYHSQVVPTAMVPRNIMAVMAKGIAKALKTVGMAIGRDIWISPDYADFNTASGLALLAHEIIHVRQNESIPNFDIEYDRVARRTPADKPWENQYEMEAYCEEARIYRELLAQGYPKGKFEPLAISAGFC